MKCIIKKKKRMKLLNIPYKTFLFSIPLTNLAMAL